MKVYQINVVCGNGSTGRIATDLAERIQQEGGECRIAYGRGAAPKFIDSFKISSNIGLYIHAFLTRLTDKHGLYSIFATKRLINNIRRYCPDIIHLHNIHGYYVNYEILFRFLKNYNKPVIWTLHDCWAFTGHCAHFDYVKCDKWKEQCFLCPQKNRYPHSILIDNSQENFRRKKNAFNSLENMTIVAVSEWLKRVVKQSFLKDCSVEKISNGIDLLVMQPTESNIRENYKLGDKKIVLGVASVWEERKGLYTFFELSKHLSEKYQIVLIGLSEQQINEKPKNILGIKKMTDIKELAKWYTAADIYVNASVEETMGLTTVEAMACGTPVIVMDSTASPELVCNECGKVVEVGKLEELITAIHDLEKNNEIIQKCREHAKKYEKRKQYEYYMKLYEKILSR